MTLFILSLLSNSNGTPVWSESVIDAFVNPPSFSGSAALEKDVTQPTTQHPYPPSAQPNVAQV